MKGRVLKVFACAQAAHEVNRVYCFALGDFSHAEWHASPDWQKTGVVKGVEGALRGNTPEQLHESWLAEKQAAGWKYGAVKDPGKKEHPCMVAYSDLPPEQQKKDELFVTTVRAMARALDLTAA